MARKNQGTVVSSSASIAAIAADIGHPEREIVSIYDGPTGPVVTTHDDQSYTKIDGVWVNVVDLGGVDDDTDLEADTADVAVDD